jgi:hypothetical protein
MGAPVNVKLQNPTVSVPNWSQEAAKWMSLNAAVGGNPAFYPLTVKAAYIIGVIHSLCESILHLLRVRNALNVTYIPAYGLFASGVELLGRCVNGNATTSGSVKDLKTGFKWLVDSSYVNVPDNQVVVKTSVDSYTIEMLVALRHFAAHGQATSSVTAVGTDQSGNVDHEILGNMPPLLGDGLGRYWGQLQTDEDLCNRLAQANVIALRNWPVFRSWTLFERDASGRYLAVVEVFNRFDWRV